MKILLIGNKGQVGREVEELALEQGMFIRGVDIDSLDITDAQRMESFFASNSDFNIAINAAAYTAVDKAEDERDRAYAINCDGVKNLASSCREFDIPLLHISTDYVLAGDKTSAYTEDDQTGPLGIYGASKLAGDQALINTWEKHIILRVSWVFGKYGNNFVKTILRLAQERETLNIVGDQRGCPTGARDIARVLLEIAGKIKGGNHSWGVYNYCGSPVTTWFDFANEIVRVGKGRLGDKANFKLQQFNKITTEQYPTKAPRPKNSELVVGRIICVYEIKRHDWSSYLLDLI